MLNIAWLIKIEADHPKKSRFGPLSNILSSVEIFQHRLTFVFKLLPAAEVWHHARD